jgi:hypothetical protein
MGRNKKGIYHSAWGYARDPNPEAPLARIDHLMDYANSKGIPTIAVGDNGNEMGFGTIEKAVRRWHPFGDKCQCPCESGIASSVPSDIILPATTSNWGCYGIEACLALLTKNEESMHDPETERRMLYACANTGCPDGTTTFTTPTCDGTPHTVSVDLVELLKATVTQSFKTFVRRW